MNAWALKTPSSQNSRYLITCVNIYVSDISTVQICSKGIFNNFYAIKNKKRDFKICLSSKKISVIFCYVTHVCLSLKLMNSPAVWLRYHLFQKIVIFSYLSLGSVTKGQYCETYAKVMIEGIDSFSLRQNFKNN